MEKRDLTSSSSSSSSSSSFSSGVDEGGVDDDANKPTIDANAIPPAITLGHSKNDRDTLLISDKFSLFSFSSSSASNSTLVVVAVVVATLLAIKKCQHT